MSIPARQSTAYEFPIGPVLDADGVAVTDCTASDFKIKKTTGDFAALNVSATVTHVSVGMYDVVLTTSDTDTVGLCTVAIDDTTNACAPVRFQVIEEAVYDALYAASATGPLTTLGSNAPAGWINEAAFENNAITDAKVASDVTIASVTGAVGSVTGNVGGNVAGSVGSVTGAVGSVTGNVGGNVTGTIGGLATQAKADVNAEVDTALADYDGPTRSEATSDKNEILTRLGTPDDTDIATDIAAVKTVADALPTLAEFLAGGDVDGFTVEQSLKLILAACAAKLDGAGTTTVVIRAADDSKDRITATVDEDGNRSAVTLDAAG